MPDDLLLQRPLPPEAGSPRVADGLIAGSRIAAALCVAVGLFVLSGWYFGIPAFVHLRPNYVAMQFNTASLFVIGGAAVLALQAGRGRGAAMLALALFVIAAITVGEHLTNVSVGIDEVLWRLGVDRATMGPLANSRQSAPGRMAPNTALAFTLIGFSLLAINAARRSRAALVAAALAAVTASVLGAVAFSGYLIGVPTAYGWGQLTRMAVHTALAMVLLGSATLAQTLLSGLRLRVGLHRWLPLLGGAAMSIATLAMWQALVDHDRQSVAASIAGRGEVIADQMVRLLDDRANVVDRHARRLSRDVGVDRRAWEFTANQIINDLPGLLALAWVDATGALQWRAVSSPRYERILEARLLTDDRSITVLRGARPVGATLASEPIALDSLDWSVLLAESVEGGTRRGHIIGLVAYQGLMHDVLGADLARGYAVSLREGDIELFASPELGEPVSVHWQQTIPVSAMDRHWTLRITPTRGTLRVVSSSVPLAFLFIGLLSAGLLAWIIHSAQLSHAKSRHLLRLVDELAIENEARRQAELRRDEQAEELAAQSEELEQQNASLHESTALLEQQRDELERAQEFRAALVRSTVDGVASFNSAGEVVAWNPAMATLTGLPTEDVIGRAILGRLRFLSTIDEMRLVNDTLAGQATHRLDVRVPRPDGDIQWLDVVLTPMRAVDGNALGGLVVARNVTDRKRAADLIEAERRAAEEANRAKSNFLARMSHELRTPLNSVIGFTNVLRRNRNDRLDETALLYLERINANGRHLLGMINEVLDLSKIEAGHETVALVSLDVGAIARDTSAELEVRATENGVLLQVELDDYPEQVISDPVKLKQVLINLIGNAIKFTPRGGTVTVRLLAGRDGNGPVGVEVQDTGIGIPAHRLTAIFEAFEQADEETSRAYGGTGLGLAISRQLCTLMGHELLVRSELGAGSVFTVLFEPAATRQAAAEQGVSVVEI